MEGHNHGYGAGTWVGWRDIIMGMVQGHNHGYGTAGPKVNCKIEGHV